MESWEPGPPVPPGTAQPPGISTLVVEGLQTLSQVLVEGRSPATCKDDRPSKKDSVKADYTEEP